MAKYFNVNAPGHSIHCKQYAADHSRPDKAVIFFTGFAGHKDNTAAEKFAEKLLSKQKNVIVVVFNWPAHGDDVKKKLTLEDCDAYIELVTDAVRKIPDVRELYAYGTSFGGYLLLKYISEHGNPFRKIALRCPAVDMYDVLTRTIMRNDEYERIRKGKDAMVGFDRKILVTPEFLDSLRTNDIRQRDFLDYADDILIIHGTSDEVVPFESVRTFSENNVIEFIPVEKADHRFQNPTHMSLANKMAMEFFGFLKNSPENG